ncbi:hypothetical protein scyTo_0016029, partial [Scyliorhinus torazame]|nr:hypothetical protein [Scyliorhinus torazame]
MEQERRSLGLGNGAGLEMTDFEKGQGRRSLTLRRGAGLGITDNVNRMLRSTRRSLRLKVRSCVFCVSKAGIERSISVEEKKPEQEASRYSAQSFFEYLVVVSLKKSGAAYEPQIAYQFPKRENLMRSQKEEEENLLKAIPLFCFPDCNTWAPLTEYESETFSFVLTKMDGSRKFGYCRRLLPRGGGARLPEVFCIISCLGCFGLFSQILDEVEKRRQISLAVIYPFMQGLREAAFPAPGKTVSVKSFIPESGTEIIKLTRPSDSRLEHVDFSSLFKHLSEENVIQIFASLLLERRLIFLAEEL